MRCKNITPMQRLYATLSSSLKLFNTTYPVLVVLDDSVLKQYERHFRELGAVIVQVPQADCNAAKMSLWSLTTYNRIAYIEPSSVVVDNIDHIFSLPVNSVLMDKWPTNADKFLIFKPDTTIYESLIRQARSRPESSDSAVRRYLVSIKIYPIPNHAVKLVGEKTPSPHNATLLMYSGDITPWNWYKVQDKSWLNQWDQSAFWHWRHHRNQIQYLFNSPNELMNSINRTEAVCNNKSFPKVFPITEKFSVLFGTYNPERIDHVTNVIKHLAASNLVHTIYLTWHNPKLKVNNELKVLQATLQKPLVILEQTFDSLNNRFNPIEGLETDAVYILDDDIVVPLPDLEFTFQVWKNRQDSIVGHFPRFHSYDPSTSKSVYAMADDFRPSFSIVLTKSMFIRSEYLFAYTCLMSPALHTYVDEHMNCEDIGFSFMVSGLTATTNTYVRTQERIRDYGLNAGISTNNQHIAARRDCVTDFVETHWNKQDPTRMSSEVVSMFEKVKIQRAKWGTIARDV
ncbi:hypothetical protein INT43_005636 [Umbelopsis isabellina]|uniref:Glycosyl transferase 64 domain-containing protein n=1 Tax=Mortierella isabellina TaxID=91625 RepID=A0A8H7PLW1_MORIS|nr:hypothetical protein INT43_005636 [Umbelopsis isabellina]